MTVQTGVMDGADETGWSAVASEWAELWGTFSAPARHALVAATGIRSGSRVLDVGCGSGEFLAMLVGLGADAAGIDPAPAMVDLARATGAEVCLGEAEHLPWPDATFDVVTAVNALQFADDTDAALAEFARVTVPGGFVAIANWAEGSLNDLNVIEAAIADGDLLADGDLRQPGGLEAVLSEAGLEVTASGVVEVPWEAHDEETLVRGILLGEDAATMAAASATVVAAAHPFRTADGGYRLVNAFRYAVARTPS